MYQQHRWKKWLSGSLMTAVAIGQPAAFAVPMVMPVAEVNAIEHTLAQPPVDAKDKQQISQGLSRLAFQENKGQWDDSIAFYTKTIAGDFVIRSDGQLVLKKTTTDSAEEVSSVVFTENFIGATRKLHPAGQEAAMTKINYIPGFNKDSWVQDVQTYNLVSLGEVWKGIQVEVAARENNTERFFHLAPHANPKKIQVQIADADLAVDDQGRLVAEKEGQTVQYTAPIAWQEINGQKTTVEVAYQVQEDRFGFTLGKYDPDYSVTIDPAYYSTYFASEKADWISSVQAFGDRLLVRGESFAGVPGGGGFTPSSQGPGYDPTAFLATVSWDLKTVYNVAYLGSSPREANVKTDNNGNVYFIGNYSDDWRSSLPTPTLGLVKEEGLGIIKLSRELNPLQGTFDKNIKISRLISTVNPIAKELLIAGITSQDTLELSPGLSIVANPTSMDAFQRTINRKIPGDGSTQDVYVARFSMGALTWQGGSFFGGTEGDSPSDILFDSDSNALYILGKTQSRDLPAVSPSACQKNDLLPMRAFVSGFITRLNPALTQATSTYYGAQQVGSSINMDPRALYKHLNGKLYAVGMITGEAGAIRLPSQHSGEQGEAITHSYYVPVSEGFILGGIPKDLNGCPEVSTYVRLNSNAFEINLVGAGISPDGSIYTMGYSVDNGVDGTGNPTYVLPSSRDTLFPAGGSMRYHLTQYSPDLKVLTSTYLPVEHGDDGMTQAGGLAFGPQGQICFTGHTKNRKLTGMGGRLQPTPPAFQSSPSYDESRDGFLSCFDGPLSGSGGSGTGTGSGTGAQALTAGQGQWYYNSSQPGTGLFIERSGENHVFLAYFFYDASGKAMWAVATGSLEGNQLTAPLMTFQNGQTLMGSYRPAQAGQSFGNIQLNLGDANKPVLTVAGTTLSLERFDLPGSRVGTPAVTGAPQNGWWWTNQPGTGFAIETQGDQFFVVGFMYREDGSPTWYLSAGSLTNGNTYRGTWSEFAGGQALGQPYKPAQVSNANVGSLAIQWASPTTGELTLPNGQKIAFSRFAAY